MTQSPANIRPAQTIPDCAPHPDAGATGHGDATAPSEAAPRRRLPSAERRREFITKAIDFFAEEGFESSTRGLARRLGVTQPLLYRYFPSKEDLVREVYDAVFLNRWRPEWAEIIAARQTPLRARLITLYTAYTDVIFDRIWFRIYLFSGLRGIDINRQYMKLVRERMIEPIISEALANAGLPARPASEDEVEFVWTIHSGLFYFGARSLIYGAPITVDKSVVIADAVDAMMDGLGRKFRAQG